MRNIIVAAALALTACTGSTNYWNAYTPVRAKTTQPKNAAVQRAVVAITDAGREIESSDAATGIVISKWWSGDGFGGESNRFRIRVTFDDTGAYEIVALCQGKVSSGWEESNCEPNKRPQFVLDTVAKVDASLKAP